MASTPLRVAGFGHPLLDISTHVDVQYIQRYNVAAGATMLATPEQMGVYEEICQRPDVEYVPGGATMNAIRVCRWLVGEEGGCSFVGALGNDDYAKTLESALVKNGVTPLFDYMADTPTGTCACLIVGKERSLIANLGAALKFNMTHFNSPKVQKVINETQIFYAAGFFLNTDAKLEAPLSLARHCAEEDKVFSMNLSAPYLCHIFKDAWKEMMPYIDFLFGNKNDALAYAEAQGWEETGDHLGVAYKLVKEHKVNKKRGRVVIITHGSDPTVVATDDGIVEFETPTLNPDDIVDLNGAGDAFVGGFLSQLSRKKSLSQCIRAGQYSAQVIIRHHGCSFPEKSAFKA